MMKHPTRGALRGHHVTETLLAALAMVIVTAMGWSSAQGQDQHGSIAFSQEANGGYNYGISWNHATRDSARSRAVQECRSKGGGNCGEVLAFWNTCGALAVGGGNGYGTGGGDSVAEAERSAISKCREYNASCRIEASRCSKPAPVVKTEPKCAATTEEGAQCWMEYANKPGCLVWDDYFRTNQRVTWSGACSNGVGIGRGTEIWTFDGKSMEATGTLAGGKPHGHWTVRWPDGAIEAGPYVNGKMHGHWTVRWPDGTTEEGPYVNGEKQETHTRVGTDQDQYGSIAFEQLSGGGYAWGIAWSYDSWESARDRATRECRSTGSRNCTEGGWFRNACGALAIGDENGYGTGWGDSIALAESSAMSNCRAANQNCRVEEARCAGDTTLAKRQEPKPVKPKRQDRGGYRRDGYGVVSHSTSDSGGLDVVSFAWFGPDAGEDERRAARNRAVQECRRKSSSGVCGESLIFYPCLAWIVTGFGAGDSLAEAEREIVSACEGSGHPSRNCRIQGSACADGG